MKIITFIIFSIILDFNLFSDEIYIVESVPLETVYGSSLTLRTYDVWNDMISSATKTIDFEEFYIENKKDEDLYNIMGIVLRKAKQGIKIRILIEKAMMKTSYEYIKALEKENIEIRVIDFKKLYGGIQHSKFFIVDNRDLFVGSQNLDWRSLTHIHELGVRIKSEKAASELSEVFNYDFEVSKDYNKKDSLKIESKLSCPNFSQAKLNGKDVSYCFAYSPEGGGDYKSEIAEIIDLIRNSKKNIYAQVMTYSDKNKFYLIKNELIKAAKRGVKVKIIFSDWAVGKKTKDKMIKKLLNDGIEIKISSIPQYSKGYIPYSRVEHLKYIIVDDEYFLISTSNWGYDYFYETRGVSVLIKGSEAGRIAADIFNIDWNLPYVKYFDPTKCFESLKKE